jgi:hypothetical protein
LAVEFFAENAKILLLISCGLLFPSPRHLPLDTYPISAYISFTTGLKNSRYSGGVFIEKKQMVVCSFCTNCFVNSE